MQKFSNAGQNPYNYTMQSSYVIGDKSFRALFNASLKFEQAPASVGLQQIFGEDWFSVTQYLLGKQYYQERIKKIFDSGQNFVDVGCGIGNWTKAATGIFETATGIDINENRIAIARKLSVGENAGNLSYVAGNVKKLPFADASFDGLLCFNVITFIDFPHEELLQELRRIARPGAKFYLTAHDTGFLFWLIYQALLNRSRPKMRTALQVAKNNLRYTLLKRGRPTSFFSRSYINPLFKKTGWELLQCGLEGDCTANKQASIFRKRFFGCRLMNEYILKAV